MAVEVGQKYWRAEEEEHFKNREVEKKRDDSVNRES